MPTPIHEALGRLALGETLSAETAAAAFSAIMRGEAAPTQIAGLLLGLRARGETAEEIAGAATALRNAMVRVPIPDGMTCVDTCGTGGGSVTTINISTAAAFVTRGAGVPVAKHGNRSFTSRCGSTDVLTALGVPLPDDRESARAALEQHGIVFLFAPHFHPAMRNAAEVRRDLGVPTLFNIVGPLANPAGVRRQVVGVADPSRAPLVASALTQLQVEHALVVHGRAGLDEISPTGESDVWEVRQGSVTHWVLSPGEWGLEAASLAPVQGGLPEENAARLESVLRLGTKAPGHEAVVLNAAGAVYVSGRVDSFKEAVERARTALASGAAHEALERARGT
jgi:anthranilate phosphoribosyltransferase